MKFSLARHGEVAVVTVSGRLSSAVADSFQDQLLSALDQISGEVMVDFSQLTFITSSGLRALILAAKRGRVDGFHVHLCGMADSIREVFEVSGLMRIFIVHPSLDEGLAAIAASPA